MNRAALRKEFLTLRGHLTLVGAPIAVIMTLIELYEAYIRGWLTWPFALRTIVFMALSGATVGGFLWYTGTRPYLRRSKQ